MDLSPRSGTSDQNKPKHGKSWKIGKSLNISGISEQTQREATILAHEET